MSQNLSSAAVVIGALMVKVKSKLHNVNQHCELHMLRDFLCRLIIYNFSWKKGMFKKSADDKFTQNLIFGLAMIHICAKLARIGGGGWAERFETKFRLFIDLVHRHV